MDLCKSCKEMGRTHRAPSKPCTGGARRGYNNCFDERGCKELEAKSDVQILHGLANNSGCLSMNHTRQAALIVRERLLSIARRIAGGQ